MRLHSLLGQSFHLLPWESCAEQELLPALPCSGEDVVSTGVPSSSKLTVMSSLLPGEEIFNLIFNPFFQVLVNSMNSLIRAGSEEKEWNLGTSHLCVRGTKV